MEVRPMVSLRSAGFLFGAFCLLTAGSRAAFAAPTCSLLTAAEITAVVGGSPNAGVPSGDKVCSWSVPPSKDKKSPGRIVTVTLMTPAEFAAAKTPHFGTIVVKPISGVGDEAVFNTVGKFGTLCARKGSSNIMLRIYGVPVEESEAKERALTLNVLAKL
jgi:hypothetical protein